MKRSTARSHRSLPALTGLVAASLTLAGCGGGSDHASPAARPVPSVTHAVPFAAAASIAAPEHAAVARAVQALAAAELKLSQDIAPLAKANDFTSYLRSLAGAAAQSRAGVAAISGRGGDCSLVQSGISVANTGVLDSALGRLSARVSVLRASLSQVSADKTAVTKAAATLKAALAKDPGAWRVPGVDEIGSTLSAVAKWQTDVAAAIATAEGKAAGYSSVRATISARAAAVGSSCHRAASREKVRAAAAPTTAAAHHSGPTPGAPGTTTTAPAPSAPGTTTAPVPVPTTSAPAPSTSPPAPPTTTPAPEPSTTTPAPPPTTTSPPVPSDTLPPPVPTTTAPVAPPTTGGPSPESTTAQTSSPSPG